MSSVKKGGIVLSAAILGAGLALAGPAPGVSQNSRQLHSIQSAPGSHNNGKTNQGIRSPHNQGKGGNRWNKEKRNHRDKRHKRDDSAGVYWGIPYGFSNYEDSSPGEDPYKNGYSDGFRAGQYDHAQGNLYNPRQYERSGNADYFQGFVAGYQDAFRQ